MYGTVAKVRVKPENREKLQQVVTQGDQSAVDGYVTSYVSVGERGRWRMALRRIQR